MKFKNIQADYHGKIVLHGLSGKIEPQQITMLLGQNGAGKSTLMEVLSGLKKARGEYDRVESMIYLPQKNEIFDYLRVEDLLAMGKTSSKYSTGMSLISTALDLNDLLNREILSLSSGQQQRVWLAYTLLQDKDIALLDEPLAFLDLKYQQRLLNLLVKLKEEFGKTFLLSIHDPIIARSFADVVWLLDSTGLMVGKPEKLLTKSKVNEFFELE
ncbi:ABC transporter ATP-binding protein [Ligilactobacillus acidipiscis]|uniref:ABC transporter ATP-binding protein n=1 Tax=Ligilactobacillus acidipiscis TaxID=89059 RepID=A0A921FAV1_9LACO|nr:ABC transporter ATP-binding protein [Ligilactobacillus acidipiscis]MCI1924787.1 ABC transporter ATP-binding protein [Ligilactobacillus acidipiscis]MCI1954044.1 ABC transporter ATP-binding protein [Ligilactobacillus acidipiscis]WEV57080.1 ABC transporter ATP-binding protein [Ligilactobacillus acidipiscis]HJE98355.1 ABC transporter ATP-binding protein [Ligilactobacillus acidipiscis]